MNPPRVNRKKSLVLLGTFLVAGFCAWSSMVVAGGPNKQAPLSTHRKPAVKNDVKRVGSPFGTPGIPADKLPHGLRYRAASPAALLVPVTIDAYDSWDLKGDTSNVVLAIDVAGLAGLGTGNPATMTGVGWDVTIDTTSAPAAASWLSEATVEFDENVAPGTNWISLRPGFGDDFAGVATYSSGGIVDFTDNLLPDIFLPDGVLRIELYEQYDDAADVIDAFYNAVSTMTIALLDTSSGACCLTATATCIGNSDQATCEGTAGYTWYAGQDCLTFACPPPPADYLMDGTPVTTCSGTFADSGDTSANYSNSENIVKTFTPATAGQSLQFTFTFFDTEGGYDFLTVYNGNSTAAPVIGVFDNDNPPTTVVSTAGDGTLTFQFTSDSSVALAGWIASIACVAPPTTGACCDGIGGCTDVAEGSCTGLYLGTGTSCAANSCPQPGDNCLNTLVVDLSTDLPYSDVGQTTCGRGNDYSATCLGSYDGGEDIIYELVVPSNTCVDIVMTSDSTYTGIGLDSACPLGDPCLAKATSSATGQSLLTQNLTAGTYYLMLDTWPAPDCINSFNLSITACPATGACCHEDGTCTDVAGAGACTGTGDTYLGDGVACATAICPPANDLCDNATKITTVPFADSGVVMPGATDDANVDPSCDSSFSCANGPANNGVWYTFTPSVSCAATIDQTGIDAATSVWTGADCLSLTQLACSDPDPFTVDMAAGTEYLILVSNWSCSSQPSANMNFTFDCVALPKGACCVQGAGVCSCTEVAGVDCAGTYKGDNTSCTDTPDPCDCNTNGTCDTADLLPGVAQEFGASGLALAIPDLSVVGADHVINVPTGGNIADLNVRLQVTHTWVGDLCATLTHPNGTTSVTLLSRPGLAAACDATGCCGCSGNNYNITLDDGGSGGTIEALCGAPNVPVSPPSYTPDEALSAFNGLDMAGNWTLHLNDNGSGDTGTLDAWTLQFNALPAVSSDCNGNGIPDECEADCDSNGVPDDCDVDPSDPDGNGLVAPDCNSNGLPDACDVPPIGSGPDCQPDGIPDSCQLGAVSSGEAVADGSFEAGSPSPSWAEASTNFGTPLCTIAACGTGLGTGPRTGDWWTWFGGIAAAEVGSMQQSVTLPAGANTLTFYLEIPASSGNGTDFINVRMDGNILFTAFENTPGYSTYALVSVDISAYADGGSHLLRFESTISGAPSGTNFFVDDVSIVAPTGPAPNDCNGNGVPDECDTAVCGDNCLQTGEDCDGTADAACPGACYPSGGALGCQCPSCGDGVVNPGESCDGGVCCTTGCAFDSGTACRPPAGVCDVAEFCNGSSAGCPADGYLSGSVCRPAAGVCDAAESCNGSGVGCPADVFLTGSVCRPAADACDIAESCGGSGVACPADVRITSCTNGDGCCAPGCNAVNDDDCTAVCGNDVAEGTEECDGTDAVACPGECQGDCTCPAPIPTVSEWGVVVMVLVLLVGGRVYFGRRAHRAHGS